VDIFVDGSKSNKLSQIGNFTSSKCRVVIAVAYSKVAIPSGDVLEGKLQKSKLKLVQAWVEIHQDELMANWQLAVNGQQVLKINPLQ
jgi:hypothetical protein